jgi:UDP-2,3-diacylglucosamine hydrolase
VPGKLGILAGGGELPRRLAQACRASGRSYHLIAFQGEADAASLAGEPHDWTELAQVGRTLGLLRDRGCEDVVLAGRVRRPALRSLVPDARGALLMAKLLPRMMLGDDGLLRVVVGELEGEGFHVVGAESIIGGLLMPLGQLGRIAPDEGAQADIVRGRAVALALGAADVGQAVIVQQGIVLGVEAIEGTDALIDRCRGLHRPGPGGVLVKLRKPDQDRRVDLPAIGPDTVRHATAGGLVGIAAEAGGTLLIDREAATAAADAAGLFLIGFE